MRILLSIAFALISFTIVGQKKLQFEDTPVTFTVKNAGFNVHGSIGGLEGFVTMDGSSPVNIEGNIDPNTVRTGIDLRDRHLKKSDYFNVAKYPRIAMKSDAIVKKGKNKYIGTCSLTIKDVTKKIEIPFTFSHEAGGYLLKGEFTINRLDFNVGDKSITLSDNVKIKIEFKASDKSK